MDVGARRILGEEEEGKMPRKGVKWLEILRGGVQKWEKSGDFGQKKNSTRREGDKYGIMCAFSRFRRIRCYEGKKSWY